MKALLLLLLAGIPFATANAEHDRQYEGEYDRETMKPVYEWVCEYMDELYEDFECPPQPVVVTAKTKPGLWGYYYRGSSLVWISTRISDQPLSVFGEAIVAHEMIHYVLSEIDDLQPKVDACRNENLAWTAFNEYVVDYGFYHLYNSDWWEWYPNCSGPEVDREASLDDLIEIIEELFPESY